ncbi:Importin-beta like gene [Scheffersomyces stipitis CBS 6054]|uniref:Importin-beta like protein n=1 Tax=Scheffersomyces stipitis (strain ATCC 58785 / CBS 6054 / NBRC 10063 / NRRL Y-11545) TaxID=322104 RepID=A3LND4_PICST|nr:Importin-beta like gene [Scheffersomyces stipitis CBS 6054]ABN64837.2 Importin-beta like gene [Scheffersomyces stipitis CBS 6054]
MDKPSLLKALAGTLDADFHTRKSSERQLNVYEQQPGFTAYLLELITDPEAQLGIQISAAILFKNRVMTYWLTPENKAPSPLTIRDNEKPQIKEKLIQTLIKTYKNTQLKLQLSTALHNILSSEKWDEILAIIKNLLNDSSNIDHVYVGLICLYEYTKNYRWSSFEHANSSNPVLEDVANEVFPQLQTLIHNLINSDSATADEMTYLIVKIFKFTTFSSLPSYFLNTENLGNWCQIHIMIINKPLPASVLNEDSIELRNQNPRIKAVKWCFGNLHRLLSRHGGGITTKDKTNNQFATAFLENFVPVILNAFWKIIEEWSTKQIWLSESSLYHIISFLEQIVDTPAWNLINDKIDAIIKHVILPTLNATEETIELYEDDSDEYIRRFFDTNRESNTADVASINFIYRLSVKRFTASINTVLAIVNDIFNRRAGDRGNVDVAKETEGAFRVLSTLSHKLDNKNSPVHGQVDKVLHTFIYPELAEPVIASTPWLTARACDTLAMFRHNYKDQEVLRDIFQGVVNCFQKEDQFPIQLTAVDALCTLVEEDTVAEHVGEQAPQLMGTLLEMSKKFESDILTSVMETFVEKFAKNLEPYATELARKLMEQFLRTVSELMEQQSADYNNVDVDKEYKAAGVLGTLTSLVIAMGTSPEVSVALEGVLSEMIIFILENAQVSFLCETIEILESLIFSSRNVSPVMWNIYQVVIDSFDTYAHEYFDSFQPFFEGIINHGFTQPVITVESPQIQQLLSVCFKLLKSDSLDPVFAHSTFEIMELTILALNTRFVPILPQFLPEIFETFSSLESQDAFDGYMLHHLSILRVFFAAFYVDPVTTIQFLNEKGFTPALFQLWIKHSSDFQSVYGCKLQILASISIIRSQALTLIPEDLIGETVDLMVDNISTLPSAIKAKNDILQKESSKPFGNAGNEEEDDEYNAAYYEDELEADEAELEALKQTPIDEINVFQVIADNLQTMIHQDPGKYEALFGGVSDNKKEMLQQILHIVHEKAKN